MPWITGAIIGGSALLGGAISQSGQGSGNAAIGASLMPRWTPYSQVNSIDRSAAGYAPGITLLDPSIRALREQSLQYLPGYRSSVNNASNLYQNQLTGLQSQLQGNQSPFLQATLAPLIQQQQTGRQQLSQGLARRGVFGSLSANAMGNYDATTGAGIANAGALALNNQIGQSANLAGSQFGGVLQGMQGNQSIDTEQQNIANQNLQQELAALGLSQANIQGLLGGSALNMQGMQNQNDIYGRSLYGLGIGLGAINQNGGFGSSAPASLANYGGSGSVSSVPYGGFQMPSDLYV